MSVTSTETIAAETLADVLTAALYEPSLTPLVERLLARYQDAPPEVAVPLRDAASELGVTVPTVRSWIARGLLVETTTTPRSVSIPSLAVVLAARATGEIDDDPRPAARILDQLRDHHLLEWARGVAAATPTEEYLTYTDADLDELER